MTHTLYEVLSKHIFDTLQQVQRMMANSQDVLAQVKRFLDNDSCIRKRRSTDMPNINENIDTVRTSRAGHTFHERWPARRALQLVFPNDGLFAIAVEGISSTETATLGPSAEEVADLVLYYGDGDNFQSCERLETVQFKYKLREEPVTASYLKKTIKK